MRGINLLKKEIFFGGRLGVELQLLVQTVKWFHCRRGSESDRRKWTSCVDDNSSRYTRKVWDYVPLTGVEVRARTVTSTFLTI